MKRNQNWKRNLTGAVALLALPGAVMAQNTNDAEHYKKLQAQVDALTKEVERLKEGPPMDPTVANALNFNFLKGHGLTVGFYGEAKYRFPEEGANVFDPHRFVLTPTYRITDWLIFNSELEFEHGAVDESNNSGRNRFDGEMEIEQFYVDILINPHFNIRSLGIDLVPVGRINKYHEPTLFYSTERPELYREIIPSTWFEPAMSIWGKITDTLDYQLMVSTGLEDQVRNPSTGALIAAPGIEAAGGMRSARPRLRRADENHLAYSGRLHYNGLPGLDTSASFYVTEVEGMTDSSYLALGDIEVQYRVPNTGLELRGDFAYWHISDPENLVANNNALTTDDVGGRMYGWYTEAAYHFWPECWKEGKGKEMDFVPFIRYSEITTQSDLLPGSVKTDNGTRNKQFVTLGVAYFLNRNFVLKADYRRNLKGHTAARTDANAQDYFQIGAGVFF